MESHPELFCLEYPEIDNKYNISSNVRLCVDEERDYQLISIIFKYFYPNLDFNLDAILDFLANKPELIDINKNVQQKTT